MSQRIRVEDHGARLRANARYLARNVLGASRYTAPLLARLRARMRGGGKSLVRPDSDLCIEGFPRSGNTWVVTVLQGWNPGLQVASHLHVPSQLDQAIHFGIPAVVLVRAPEDAVTSLLAVDPDLHPGVVLRTYAWFSRRAFEVRDRVQVHRFEDAIDAPWRIVQRLNREHGLDLHAEALGEQDRRELHWEIRWRNKQDPRNPELLVAVPSEERERRKELVRAAVLRHPGLAEARYWYRRLKAHADHD